MNANQSAMVASFLVSRCGVAFEAATDLARELVALIGAAITPTPDTTTAEVAAMPITRSGISSNLDRNPK